MSASERRATVGVEGLVVSGRFGVTEAERAEPQEVLVDLTIELAGCAATATDSVADTADYGVACELAGAAAKEQPFETLERFCGLVSERLAQRYLAQGLQVESIKVRACKPDPPLDVRLDRVCVEIARESS